MEIELEIYVKFLGLTRGDSASRGKCAARWELADHTDLAF
jgi:hypothetical protein